MSSPNQKAAGAAAEDEIEKLMSEIKELQQNLAAPPAATPSVPTPVVASAPEKTEVSASNSAQTESPVGIEPSSSEDSIEDAIAYLKEDPTEAAATQGKGLLDTVVTESGAESVAETEKVTVVLPESFETESASTVDPMAHQNAADQIFARKVVPITQNGVSMDQENEGTLTMSLTGNMKLTLNWQAGGQNVTVGFSGEFLVVKLADGTEFKVPVQRTPSRTEENQAA